VNENARGDESQMVAVTQAAASERKSVSAMVRERIDREIQDGLCRPSKLIEPNLSLTSTLFWPNTPGRAPLARHKKLMRSSPELMAERAEPQLQRGSATREPRSLSEYARRPLEAACSAEYFVALSPSSAA